VFEDLNRPWGAMEKARFEPDGDTESLRAGAAMGVESNMAILILLKGTLLHSD